MLDVFQRTKQILCANNYYIFIPKKTLHVTNTEEMLPHLMGLQYVGKFGAFTGNRGVYMIKKERITYNGIRKLVQKYYRKSEKQSSILAMIYGKINYLYQIENMLSSRSKLYLYDISANPDSELKTDYLLINQTATHVLQLGLVKVDVKNSRDYHCNSFMVDFKKNKNYDLHYRNLKTSYEISKIVKEDKMTGSMEVIYQSQESKNREIEGIIKMLGEKKITAEDNIIKAIYRLNVKFGCYHTLDMLMDTKSLIDKCRNKRDRDLVEMYMNEVEKLK